MHEIAFQPLTGMPCAHDLPIAGFLCHAIDPLAVAQVGRIPIPY